MSEQIDRAAREIFHSMIREIVVDPDDQMNPQETARFYAQALAAAGLLASPAHDAAVAATAWAEGHAVGEDNFIHSDYCGMRGCQCQGLHGTTNPYLTKGADDV